MLVGVALLTAVPWRFLDRWLLLSGVVTWVATAWFRFFRRARQVAEQRRGESICTFARSFERRTADPWVLRAVYEQLATWVGHPVRAGDDLRQVLWLVDDELTFLVNDICQRAGRSITATPANCRAPLRTVRDLVLVVERQPTLVDPPKAST